MSLDPRDTTIERLGPAKCPVCNSSKYREGNLFETMVGYRCEMIDGKEHNHDDNCRKSEAQCENGHNFAIRYQNYCDLCDWVGKTTCFCDKEYTFIIKRDKSNGI